MKFSLALTAVMILMFAGPVYSQPGPPSIPVCAATLPAGLVIRVEPDERIIAGTMEGPLMLTVTSDVSLFPAQPPLVPRSSKLFARTIESQDAGHLWGKARYQMTIDHILTPAGCEYDLDAKLIDAGKYKVQNQAIVGQGHAGRDLLLWLFPPTTLYQLIRLPARGPKLILGEETNLAVRLFENVELNNSDLFGSTFQPDAAADVRRATMPCADKAVPGLYNPIQTTVGMSRPVRNMTAYAVTVSVEKTVVSRLGPCFGSMITVPFGVFTVTAEATVLGPRGQQQLSLDVVVNTAGTGWDIVERPAVREEDSRRR